MATKTLGVLGSMRASYTYGCWVARPRYVVDTVSRQRCVGTRRRRARRPLVAQHAERQKHHTDAVCEPRELLSRVTEVSSARRCDRAAPYTPPGPRCGRSTAPPAARSSAGCSAAERAALSRRASAPPPPPPAWRPPPTRPPRPRQLDRACHVRRVRGSPRVSLSAVPSGQLKPTLGECLAGRRTRAAARASQSTAPRLTSRRARRGGA